MGEGFKGEYEYSKAMQRRHEKDSAIEVRERLQEIDKLLARLLEQGIDLPSNVRQALKDQLHTQMAGLGLDDDDFYGLSVIRIQLEEKKRNVPTPPNYPSLDKFQLNMIEVLKSETPERLPAVPPMPRASEVAYCGQLDWSMVKSRSGIDLATYHYELGKVLCSEFHYTEIIEDTDHIKVASGWRVENGRHRSLALRTLGEDFVLDSGMNDWVKVKIEE